MSRCICRVDHASVGAEVLTDMLDELSHRSHLSRRQVLTGLIALGLVPAGVTSLTGCEQVINDIAEAIRNRPTRRNVANLTENDDTILAYVDAVTQMQALPSTDPRSWEAQAEIHNSYCPHRNWLFLPWHRHYLYWFEKIVRELSGAEDWALPYWNWIENPQIPSVFQSGVLDHPRFSTSVTVTGATADAAMGQTPFIDFGSGSITASQGQRTGAAQSDFENDVHDTVHVQIGSTMASFHSPLDPIFWLHHNMIEYMWVEWNLGRGNPNPSDSDWVDREFTGNFVDGTGDPVVGIEAEVGFSGLWPLLSYQFENSLVGTMAGTV